jgi:OmpA-OmpF porin, OOP family
MVLFDRKSDLGHEVPGSSRPPDARGRRSLWPWLFLALAAVCVFFSVRAYRHLQSQVRELTQENNSLNARLNKVSQQSLAATEQAAQAAESAQAAARQRDQARMAQVQSENDALEAHQQAAAAQQAASVAEQKADEYRQQREAELARLQQALGQIAETRRTAMGLVMTLGSNSVKFDFDKAEIKPQYREILSRIAGVLMGVRGYSVYVYGYTDDIGTQAYNLELSKRRADAVRDYLLKAGLDPTIITAKGFGKTDPRVRGDSAKARAMNRRVEIGLVDSTIRPAGGRL